MMLLGKKDPLSLSRPVPKIDLEPADWIMEGIAVIELVCFFAVILYQYHFLPDTIPTHFDCSGIPDEFGRKDTIWSLPVVSLVLYGIMTMVSFIPQSFHFPYSISPSNVKKQYVLALRFVRVLKIGIVLIFFYIGYGTATSAKNPGQGIGVWLLPLIIGVTIIPLIIYFILARRYR